MYARRLVAGGHKVVVCDKPESFETLSKDLEGSGIQVLKDGHAVSRVSDFIIYSVEAAAIGAVVREYGPSTKVGATVAGQTSVKAPEKAAFDKYLPTDVDIVSVHSLHGPSVTTEGQPLVSLCRACRIESEGRKGMCKSLRIWVACRRKAWWEAAKEDSERREDSE